MTIVQAVKTRGGSLPESEVGPPMPVGGSAQRSVAQPVLPFPSQVWRIFLQVV